MPKLEWKEEVLPAFLTQDKFEKPLFKRNQYDEDRRPSDKMVSFAQRLLRTKVIHPDFVEVLEDEIDGLNFNQCRDFIDKMKPQPDRDKRFKAHRVWRRPEIPHGCYLVDVPGKTGRIEMWIKVDQSKPEETRMYRLQGAPGDLASKRIERVPFLEHLAVVLMLDPVAAQTAFADKLRHCMRCGSPLTNKVSRDANLGPECRNK
jgi:hypothetical protein